MLFRSLALPEMVDRRSGHIVNIASLAGAVPVPGQVVYAGTKFAVVGLSTAMADEFAPHGVHVSVVMPPFTATDLIAGTRTPLGSKPVAPADIAAAVVYLASKEAGEDGDEGGVGGTLASRVPASLRLPDGAEGALGLPEPLGTSAGSFLTGAPVPAPRG